MKDVPVNAGPKIQTEIVLKNSTSHIKIFHYSLKNVVGLTINLHVYESFGANKEK